MAGLHEALLSTLTWPLQKSSDTTGTVHHRRPQLQGVVAVGSGPKLSYETHETQAMSANIRNSRLMAIVATLAPIVFADARAQANSRGTEAALMPRTYEVLVVGYRDPNVTFEKTKQEWEAIRANKLSFLDTVELASIQKLTACGDTIDDDPDKPGAAEAYGRCARPVIENMPDRQGYMQGVVERVEEVLSQSYTK